MSHITQSTGSKRTKKRASTTLLYENKRNSTLHMFVRHFQALHFQSTPPPHQISFESVYREGVLQVTELRWNVIFVFIFILIIL